LSQRAGLLFVDDGCSCKVIAAFRKKNNMQRRLKIFTWHIHGSYLYYLSQGNYDIYIPVDAAKGEGYGGRGTFAFGSNVIEVPADAVKSLELDCILFQSHRNYLKDQYEVLSAQQQQLPRIYLEHDPPRSSPTDTAHPVDDPAVTLVHVTHFNKLMWDNNRTPATVIEHGVTMPGAAYTGELDKGLVVINNIVKRGRRLGLDVLQEVSRHVPLDLVGMNAAEAGGLGEVPLDELPAFAARYRFFFNPIRYTSMGLAVCEAMMLGMPIIGMATTEMPTVINNGYNGYIDTDIEKLILKMKLLLQNREHAAELGRNAKETAMQRFNIRRFTGDWESLFRQVTSSSSRHMAQDTNS
jgi:glycosyltransferase involved in cell wall biosynthesis